MSSSTHTPKYKNAPLSEVVCGIIFKEPTLKFNNKILELLNHFQKGYPNYSIQPPIPDEVFKNNTITLNNNIDLIGQIRHWLRTENGKNLIQLQNNKIFYNWTRTDFEATGDYPGFDEILEDFYELYRHVNPDPSNLEIQEKMINYFDLLYQDRIFYLDYIDNLSHIDKILNINHFNIDIVVGQRSSINTYSFQTSFTLQEVGGYGKIKINSGIAQNGKQALILECYLRGKREGEGIVEWFKKANSIQGNIFEKIIQPEILLKWE